MDQTNIIKQLPEEFKEQFECLGKNADKYISFSVLTKKYKYRIKLIACARLTSSLLSSLVDNLLHKHECKDHECCPKYETIKNKTLQYSCQGAI